MEKSENGTTNDARVADIVAWMRATADVYADAADLVGDGYAVTWRIIADLIEKRSWEER